MAGEIIRTGGSKAKKGGDQRINVEITADGYLRIPADFSAEHFSYDKCIGSVADGSYVLWPATNYTDAAILMKQRNVAGDRSVLIREIWGDQYPIGNFTALWQASRRRLVVDPETTSKETHE